VERQGLELWPFKWPALAGARVSATAGSDEKVSFCRTLGAIHALNYKTDDISAALKDTILVDVVLDMAGGRDFDP
jgi:NADPH2:quinone reductase